MALGRTQFNTENFSWSDVTVKVGDQTMITCQGISYESAQDKEEYFGKGSMPQGIGRGNKTFKGELRLRQIELEQLIEAAPNSDLLDYRALNINIAYKSEAGKIVADSMFGAEFTNVAKSLQQADKTMVVALPIIFLGINYNI